MSLDKYKGQNIIDDFVSSNDAEFKRISFDNPQLFDASIMALDFLSKRFGKSEQMKKVVVEEIKEAKEEETSLDLLPFAIGEKYLSKNSDIVFEIVEFTTDRDGEAMVKVKNVAEGGIGILDVDDIVQKIKNGKWIKVEDEIVETLPLKVGDRLKVNNQKGNIYTIQHIDTSDDVNVSSPMTGDTIIKKWQINDHIKSGHFIKLEEEVQALPFQLGQFVWDKQQSELVMIGYKTNNILDLVSYRQKRNKSVDTLKEDIKLGASILLKFKVGDIFIDNDDNIYEIYGLVPNTPINVMVIKNGVSTSLLWEYIDNKIIYGEWVLVDKLPFKVGDAFKVSKTQLIFRIESINDDNVFVIYEDGLTATYSINLIKDGLKSGYYVPSTTFTLQTPTSPTTTTTGTSGSSGSITLTSGKTMSGDANNKQFLKKQKEIKKLEKEIDGLEALDDEFLDDDTKAYIIEKKKELKALK